HGGLLPADEETGVFEIPRTSEAAQAMEEFSEKSNRLNPLRRQTPFNPMDWRMYMQPEMRSGLETEGFRYYIYKYKGEIRARFMLNVRAPTPDYLVNELGTVTTKPANLEALPRGPGEPSGGEALIKLAVEESIAEGGDGSMYVKSSSDAYNF